MSRADTPAEIDDRGAGADEVNADLDLADLIEQHEATDWSAVPGISPAEASAWAARLLEARETVQEGL